jgi:hypothetical protein
MRKSAPGQDVIRLNKQQDSNDDEGIIAHSMHVIAVTQPRLHGAIPKHVSRRTPHHFKNASSLCAPTTAIFRDGASSDGKAIEDLRSILARMALVMGAVSQSDTVTLLRIPHERPFSRARRSIGRHERGET